VVFGAIAVAISTTIGAGVLALPMAFYGTGPMGLIISAVIAFFLILSGGMVADLLKSEHKPVQLPALISDILGRQWKVPIYLTLIFSMYGALSAYLIGFGRQMGVLIPLPPLVASLSFFAFGTYVVFRGTRLVEKVAQPLALLMVIFLAVISLLNFANFSPEGFISEVSGTPSLGLGVIAGTMLFALFGINIIPEINYLSKGRGLEAYSISTIICLVLYIAFSFSTIGVLGAAMTDLGTEGLALHYGGFFEVVISLFTLFALLTSFLGIGLCTQHIYNYDFGMPRKVATALTTLPALLIYLASQAFGFGFLDVLSVAGELTLPVLLMLVSYAFYKASRHRTMTLPAPRLLATLTGVFYMTIFASFFMRFIG